MRLTLLTAAVAAFVPVAAAAQRCEPDAALSRAAAELLAADHRPTGAELLHAARAAGSDAPTVEAVLLPEDATERRADAIARRARRFAAPVACGEARSEGRLLLLLAPRAGRLDLEGDRLVPRVADGWRAPRLFARAADGAAWQSAVRAAEPLALPDDLAPPVTVQLVAEGPSGPRPVAERILGRGPADAVVPDSDEPLAGRIDRLRAASDAGSLRHNRRLEQVAGRHARAVCARSAAVHTTDEGDPERRLARAGIRARHVGETVARAEDASRAYAAMLRSPSHRSALIDRRFTDVGIGRAEDGDVTCLVVLLAAWPRAVPWAGR